MKYHNFINDVRTIPKGSQKTFPVDIIPRGGNNTEWEYTIRGLESEGFIISATTKKFPTGVYIAEALTEDGKLKGWGLENEVPETILVKNVGWPFKSLKPVSPITKMGLKVVPHHTMAVVFGQGATDKSNSKKSAIKYQWNKEMEHIPYGIWGVSIADTSGIQYGQAAFEGACAMKNKNGEVYGFRLDKNSERFSKSSLALNLPEISSSMVQEAIETTITNNTDYIPNNGEGQLYIRPSVCGLSGGLGIITPDYFIFTVEVAAMGAYFAPTISVEGRKDVHRPYTGANKIAPNYGASYKIKEGVKARGYTDYLSFTTDGMVEEVATCAVGFIDQKGAFVFPPVQDEIDDKDRHILPSITRYSTIDMLRYAKEEVIIRDVHADEIQEMAGMFTMGNAVGLLHVDKLCLKEDEADKGQLITFPEESKETIFSLKEKLVSARLGQLEGFEPWGKKII